MADQQQQQQQKRDGNEERVNTSTNGKTITNINYDCLEQIFDFLDLESMLSVANTCRRLQIAAAAKFGDDFRDRRVVLHVHQPGSVTGIRIVRLEGVCVIGLKNCLAFLRCFGSKISFLGVDYEDITAAQNEYVNRYISQYCADSLISLTIARKPSFTIDEKHTSFHLHPHNLHFQKPFRNVQNVTIQDSYLESQLPDFRNWFPNLRHLELLQVEMKWNDRTAAEVSFPHLEHLTLRIQHVPQIHVLNFNYDKTMYLLGANQQLKSLDILSDNAMPLTAVSTILCKGPSISKLGLQGFATSQDVSELIQFLNEHPLIDELIVGRCLKSDDAVAFFRKVSLKHFGLWASKLSSECVCLLNKLDVKWKQDISTDLEFLGIKYFHTKLSR